MASNLHLPTKIGDTEWSKMVMEELFKRESPLMKTMGYVPPSMAYDPKPPHTHMVDYGGGYNNGAAAGANHAHDVSAARAQAVNAVPNKWAEVNLQKMLASRFGWDIDGLCPFKRVVPYKVTDEQVVVFVVAGDEAVLFHDEAALYPSDALMTQMRILIEAL